MVSFSNDFNIENIIGYLRKSRQDIEREKKTGEDTLTEQRNLMERVLNNYEIPFKIKDEIGSGDKISTRPVFQNILIDLENGKYDAIAVKEISRLGRGSYTDMGKIYDLIIQKRIFIITPWKIYDPKNNSDLRQIRFELFLSREEFETIRERLTGARYTYALQGKYMVGATPFGYTFDPQTQRLTIIEEEAVTLKLMYDLYINGLNGKQMGFQAIATYFNKIGIKTKKNVKWRANAISRMILNPVYKGQIRYRITQKQGKKYIKRPESEWIIVDDAHDSIIIKEVWDKAQEKYSNRGRNTRTKLDYTPNPLAGLIVCKKCGVKMVRQSHVNKRKNKDGSISIYSGEYLTCRINLCGWVNYKKVEGAVIEYLRMLKNIDVEKFEEIINNYGVKNIVDKDTILQSIEQKKKELNSRMQLIYSKLESGVYTDEEFLERKNLILLELKQLDEIILPRKENVIQKINIEKFREKISSVLDLYLSLKNKGDKNILLRNVFDRIELEITKKFESKNSPTKFEIAPYPLEDFLVSS